MYWRKNNLTSDDVAVDADNDLSNTPAQRRQLALDLMKAGLFVDPDTQRMTRESRAKLMEIFRMGHWEQLTGVDELHRHRAAVEHRELVEGVVPKIGALDDHELHLAEHTRFVLSAEFRRLEREKPRLARALMMHAEGHRALTADRGG